jgi:RNA recognition motif-containing protein
MLLIELVNVSSFRNFVGLPRIPARDGQNPTSSLSGISIFTGSGKPDEIETECSQIKKLKSEDFMNIYVGNLPWEIQEEDLRKSFEEFGQVASATIIKDKFTNKPRGFGFVEMPEKEEAAAAIKALNGKELKGRPMKVNEAKPKTEGGNRERDRFGGNRW